MVQFIYRGSRKINNTPKPKGIVDPLYNTMSFIVLGSQPVTTPKNQISPYYVEYNGFLVIDYLIELFHLITKSPEIIFVSGYGPKKIGKHSSKTSFVLVENQIYEMTNDGEDLRLGLNACLGNEGFIIDVSLLPNYNTFKQFDTNKNGILYYIKDNYDEGILINEVGDVDEFCYGTDSKLKGMCYFNNKDFNRLKAKINGPSYARNKFDWELYNNIKISAILDKSEAIKL